MPLAAAIFSVATSNVYSTQLPFTRYICSSWHRLVTNLEPLTSTMATKRDLASISDQQPTESETRTPPSSKRARNARSGHTQKKQTLEPTTNVTYGQRSCFPGLDNAATAQDTDEDLDFEDETDALAYLQSVR